MRSLYVFLLLALIGSVFGEEADALDFLTKKQLAQLHKAFDSFDKDKSGTISTDVVADMLRKMGQSFDKKILDELIDEVDDDKSGQLEFEQFTTLMAKLIKEDAEELEK